VAARPPAAAALLQVWGHAVSSDLVRWEHLPPALVPTPGWADADGCFSGCCVVEPSGRPVILYTGVRLRSNAEAGPLPPDEHDLGMVWIESQCAAVPEDPEDDLLVRWRKQAAPFLPLPPAHMGLTGWRDPFVFEVGAEAGGGGGGGGGGARSAFAQAREWRMLIGSGLKGQGGAALVYRSSELTAGWELEGTLCEGSSVDTGVVWECPLLVPLAPVPLHLRAATPRAPPRWLTERAAAAVAAAAREDGAAPAAAAAQLPAGRPAALRQGTLKQQLMQHVAANLGGAAALALDNGGGALGQDDAEFEFSSGAPTPGDLTTQPSIEMWPAGSPTAPPAAGVSVAAATAAAVAQASEAAAVFERAATLESWHSAAAAAAAAGAPPLDDGWPGPHGSELSIGSRLHSLTLSSDSSRQLPPDDDSRVDKFALALHRVPALQLARPPPPAAPPPPPPPQQRLSSFTSFGGTPAAPPPERQWHLFTVSPDAPANPVLYWTGFLEGTAGGAPGAAPARFDLPAAKGPYRLDLGDVLYAPNVCQDGAGRWLLWGWLQERRKVGSYAYAGCLSLPRVLHVTDEGRLVQAPAPEVASLREGRAFHARGLAVPPDAVVPVAAVSGQRLDIECTIERCAIASQACGAAAAAAAAASSRLHAVLPGFWFCGRWVLAFCAAAAGSRRRRGGELILRKPAFSGPVACLPLLSCSPLRLRLRLRLPLLPPLVRAGAPRWLWACCSARTKPRPRAPPRWSTTGSATSWRPSSTCRPPGSPARRPRPTPSTRASPWIQPRCSAPRASAAAPRARPPWRRSPRCAPPARARAPPRCRTCWRGTTTSPAARPRRGRWRSWAASRRRAPRRRPRRCAAPAAPSPCPCSAPPRI
jgi:sucrose-6-phosphate hydrolase SacC (GH32 family)